MIFGLPCRVLATMSLCGDGLKALRKSEQSAALRRGNQHKGCQHRLVIVPYSTIMSQTARSCPRSPLRHLSAPKRICRRRL